MLSHRSFLAIYSLLLVLFQALVSLTRRYIGALLKMKWFSQPAWEGGWQHEGEVGQPWYSIVSKYAWSIYIVNRTQTPPLIQTVYLPFRSPSLVWIIKCGIEGGKECGDVCPLSLSHARLGTYLGLCLGRTLPERSHPGIQQRFT